MEQFILTDEQARKYEPTIMAAVDAYLRSHIRLIEQRDDLIQDSFFILNWCIIHFDEGRNIQFDTYLSSSIRTMLWKRNVNATRRSTITYNNLKTLKGKTVAQNYDVELFEIIESLSIVLKNNKTDINNILNLGGFFGKKSSVKQLYEHLQQSSRYLKANVLKNKLQVAIRKGLI